MTLKGTKKNGYPGSAAGPPKKKKKTKTKAEVLRFVLVEMEGDKSDILVVWRVLATAFGRDKIAVSTLLRPWPDMVTGRYVINPR